jgi:HSP20 family protein
MLKDYDDIMKQMEYEMQRCSAEAMRRLMELPGSGHEFWLPKTDVYETETNLVVRVEVAGIQRDSLSVSLSADRRTLNIRGTRNEQHIDDRKKMRYHQLEVYFGPFEREVALPQNLQVDADNIGATYREGFMVVSMPKLSRQQVARSIQVEDESE